MMLMARQTGNNSFGFDTKFRYQRSSAPSKKTAQKATQREKAKEMEMAKAAEQCRPLTSTFIKVLPTSASSSVKEPGQLLAASAPAEIPSNVEGKKRRDLAKKDLEKRLKSKRTQMTKQDHTRHLAVLQFMNYQEQIQESSQQESRAIMAINVSRCFNRGNYFAKKLVTWERNWIGERYIPNGKQGCFVKSKSWFNDEGVVLAAREYLSGAGESKSMPSKHCIKTRQCSLLGSQISLPMGFRELSVNICSLSGQRRQWRN